MPQALTGNYDTILALHCVKFNIHDNGVLKAFNSKAVKICIGTDVIRTKDPLQCCD